MAKKTKMWRVKAEHIGRVSIEKEKQRVILSDKLTQEELALLAQSPLIAGFLERITQPVPTNEG
jgi:hypothetical protein